MAIQEKLSIYLSYLLRHHPEDIDLHMDLHGWVDVNELIENSEEFDSFPRNLLQSTILRSVVL